MKHTLGLASGALIALLSLSLLLHLFRISYPPKPIFDEAHFATYAADYIKYKAFFDIHPPLGKLIYAAAITVSVGRGDLGDTEFVVFKKVPKGQELLTLDSGKNFGKFPYVPLRAVASMFGTALALVFYWFLRTLGVGRIGALLGGFFVVFENALLMETRLILLNGMFMVFGLGALAMYFKKNPWPLAAGTFFGLAMAVKFSAIVFLGPLLIFSILRTHEKEPNESRKEKRGLLVFFAAAVLIFIAIFFLDSIFFSIEERIGAFQSLGYATNLKPGATSSQAFALAFQGMLSLGNYIEGGTHEMQSPWYMWPAMQIPMTYFAETVGEYTKQLTLKGNPVVWFGSTLAAIMAIAILPRYLMQYTKPKRIEVLRPLVVLLGGYIAGLLPFFTIVHRSTFLYHYFPSLIFAIGLLAWLLSSWLKLDDPGPLTGMQKKALAAIGLLVLGGFLLVAPLTYGL